MLTMPSSQKEADIKRQTPTSSKTNWSWGESSTFHGEPLKGLKIQKEWLWPVEGTAGRLRGELAYLNRIDDLLNVDPAHVTSQPSAFLVPFLWCDEGWGRSHSRALRALGAQRGLWQILSQRCHCPSKDWSPFATMVISSANPEVSATVIRAAVAELTGRADCRHLTNTSNCCAQLKKKKNESMFTVP